MSFDGGGGMEMVETQENMPSDSAAAELTPKDRAYYIQDLPLTEEAQQQANIDITEALNNLGFIYMERLKISQKPLRPTKPSMSVILIMNTNCHPGIPYTNCILHLTKQK